MPCARLGIWASEVQRLQGGRGLGAGSFGESLVFPGRAPLVLPAGVRPILAPSGAQSGQGQGPGVCVRGGTLGLVGRSQEEAQSQTPQDPAWDSRGNCESLGVWDPWGWGHPVASVSATRCELTCLQVSVSVCEPWWGPSV